VKKQALVLILIIVVISGVASIYVATNYQSNQNQQVEAAWPIGEPDVFLVDSSGKTVTTSDGQITLQIPSGALTNQTCISIYKYEDIAIPGFNIISAFRFMPEGTSFLKPATLSIEYNPHSLPSHLNETDIRLYLAQDSTVEELHDSSVDLDNHVVSGKINHFSMYWYGYIGPRKEVPYPSFPTLVGRWSRTDGADKYSFLYNGKAKTTFGEQTYWGTWVRDEEDGNKYTLNWEHGPSGKASFIDYITIAKDGKSYSGVNNYDNSIHCIREPNSPPYVTAFRPTFDLGPIVGSTVHLSLYDEITGEYLYGDPDPDDTIYGNQWVVYFPDGTSKVSEWGRVIAQNDYEFYAEKAGYYTVTARVMDEWGAIGEYTFTLIIRPNVEIKVIVREEETAVAVDFAVTNFEDKDVKVIGYARLYAYDPSIQIGESGRTFEAFRAQTELYTVPARTTVTITAQGLPDSEVSKWNPRIHPVYSLYWNAKVDGIWYHYWAQWYDIEPPITLGE